MGWEEWNLGVIRLSGELHIGNAEEPSSRAACWGKKGSSAEMTHRKLTGGGYNTIPSGPEFAAGADED